MSVNVRISVELTDRQLEAYNGVRFLVSGARCSGRSYLLAIAFVEHCLDHPNEWIKIFDHYTPFDKTNMFGLISKVFNGSDSLTEHYKLEIDHDGSMRIITKPSKDDYDYRNDMSNMDSQG